MKIVGNSDNDTYHYGKCGGLKAKAHAVGRRMWPGGPAAVPLHLVVGAGSAAGVKISTEAPRAP